MEQARTDKAIGSSLEAKVLLQIQDPLLRAKLASLPYGTTTVANGTLAVSQPTAAISLIPTPTIDKLVERLPLPVTQELWQTVAEVVSGAINLGKEFYGEQRKSLLNLLLLLVAGITLYIAFGLIEVINRIPLLGNSLEAFGALMSVIFVVRNLGKISQRKETFDRMVAYKDTIIGSQADTARIVSLAEPSAALSLAKPSPCEIAPTAPSTHAKSNGVDELRYLFLASQVELIDDEQQLSGLAHQTASEAGKIGVTTAEGVKCDRCWNYSPTVGHSTEHSAICDRCVDALAGNF
jgi:isoleucyl-tRNA synthetase